MLTIDLIIGIILILIGGVVLAYITYTLIKKKHVKMSPLYISEAVATLILGIFYVVCSCVINSGSSVVITTITISRRTPPPSRPTEITNTANISSYDPSAEKALRDLYNPNNFHDGGSNITFTSEDANKVNTNQLLDDFISYYKKTFGNTSIAQDDSLSKLIAINRLSRKLIDLDMKTKKLLDENRNRNGDRLDDVELSTPQDIDVQEEDCSMYDEVYYKYIMLVVAFIYGIIALFNSTIECKSCSEQMQTLSNSATTSAAPSQAMNDDNEKIFFTKTLPSDKASAKDVEQQKSKTRGIRSAIQVLLAWFLPIIYAVIVTVTIKPTELVNLLDITQFTEESSDIINIIEHPLNVSNTQITQNQSRQIDHVIDKIYDIMHDVQETADNHNGTTPTREVQLPFNILETISNLKETFPPNFPQLQSRDVPEDSIDKNEERNVTKRRFFGNISRKFRYTPKIDTKGKKEEVIPEVVHRKCSLEMMPIKLHTLIVFVAAYFATIFYAKITHTKLTLLKINEEQVKLLGKYILGFASLWLPSMLETFARTYLMQAKTTVATDLTLALGNITRLLANGINVRNIHRVIKQFNNVRPASA